MFFQVCSEVYYLVGSRLFTATQDQRTVGDGQQKNVKGRGVHHGHRQRKRVAVAAVPRKGQSSDFHVGRHIVAAQQQQFPARGVREQRRAQNCQTWCIQAHDNR